jgi:cytochrome P450
VQSPGVFNSFNVIDPEAHKTKRKVVGQVINEGAMRRFEPQMLEQIDIFLKLIRSACDGPKPVNMSTQLDYLACDIVGLLSFGSRLRLQTNHENRFMMRGMYYGNYISNTRMQYFRLHQLRLAHVIRYLNGTFLERYKKFLERVITRRVSDDKPSTHDLYAAAMQVNGEASDPTEGVRMSDIWSEAIVFFPAGKLQEILHLVGAVLINSFQAPSLCLRP